MSVWEENFAERTRALKPSAIRAMAKHINEPGVISFAAGAPNPGLFPHEAIAEAIDELFADPATRTQSLQYGASEGYQPLRDFVASRLGATPTAVSADEILMTSGSQQALEFVGKIFIDKGDRVICTSPTYIGALQAFGLFMPDFVGVASKDGVLDLDRLEAEFRKGAKFFYVMPDHGNPDGSCMPLEHRRAVLALARKYRVPVIEDQAYDQLQLSGEQLPTLLALDRAETGFEPNVVYLGTFSKSLTPGLRVGWIAAPTGVIQKLVSLKQASDLNSGMINQMVVDRVARKILEDHGTPLREFYRGQRDAMLAALEKHMPESVGWSKPKGGMFVWLTLPDAMSADDLLKRAFADEKIIFVPGGSFHPDGTGANTLRLSFSMHSEEKIDTGIARLARAIRTVDNENGAAGSPSPSTANVQR